MKGFTPPGSLRRHHARMKRLALFVLRYAIIPVLLTMIYVIGIGFTKFLLLFKGNPLYAKKSGEKSFWVEEKTGVPEEGLYLRQS